MSKQSHVYIDRSYMDGQLGKEEFKSDNKYRKERNRRDNQELEELKRLEQEQRGSTTEDEESDGDPQTVEQPKSTTKSNSNEDNTDWKKRYSDLRSHSSKQENAYKESITALENRLKELEKQKSQPSYPKTEEEIQDWIEKYPDVAGIIQTIAGKTSDQAVKQVQESIAELKKERLDLERANGIKLLLNKHPDFMEIKDTQNFQNWLNEQTPEIQAAIVRPKDFKENSGVKAASRVLDLYKFEAGLSTKKSKENTQSNKDKDVARKVSTSVSEDPRRETNDPVFSESQVARMTDREYEKYQDKILESQRKGTFIYDLSGAAR